MSELLLEPEFTPVLALAEQLKAHKEQIRQLLQPYQLEHTTIEFEFDHEVCRDLH